MVTHHAVGVTKPVDRLELSVAATPLILVSRPEFTKLGKKLKLLF
jgi:hypothetical protein